ncbi:hypothetical protein QJS10_CPB14g00252 [Acorus calamus]|uniref:J domain-containing protein n=1 Tax=Acorus calamus TaxID=4465 RepID=A0AAV9DE67_ACOCL|nr:hypothetical protein QJS10_CPB14g00252 [Acorus calamus]
MVSIEMERTNQRSGCYYAVLGVDRCASAAQVRAAYRKLAMTWHPDRWARGAADSSRAEEAKRRFQQIQEAYDVLSDHRKRSLYDAGLYDPLDEAEDIDGFSGFVEEMMSLMEDVRREDKSSYSLEELQRMFVEMAHGFNES